ncbi:hypothetical protein AXF42_Ash009787 [Apostasia shenzhenica]|uniref:Uncharacterized protein n=1 Tax=Apostasia shenzhenica TaxID=1088818 RepID=A0A2I0AX34_9ASPA|nr:hypothetical protein AXF42_Ash009787 [Apostasia shenzhenica]
MRNLLRLLGIGAVVSAKLLLRNLAEQHRWWQRLRGLLLPLYHFRCRRRLKERRNRVVDRQRNC